MSLPISAAASALQGIQSCLRRLDHAAAVIAGGVRGADPASGGAPAGPGGAASPADPTRADDPELAGAMVDMLVAQRSFAAQLRVLETVGQMADEASHLGERPRRMP